MIDRSPIHRQFELLVDNNRLEASLVPPPIRAEVTLLLTRLISEHIAAAALPAEAADE